MHTDYPFLFPHKLFYSLEKINQQITGEKKSKSMLEYKQFLTTTTRTYVHIHWYKTVISQKFLQIGTTASPHPGHTYKFQTRQLRVRRLHLCSKQFLISSFLDQTLNLHDLYSACIMCLVLLHKNILQKWRNSFL